MLVSEILKNIHINIIISAPLSATIEPQVQTIDFGRSAALTCNPEGNPIKSISWMKDGVLLSHNGNVLRIDAVRREDRGMYQCFVRNDQESAQASAEIKLGGRCKNSTALFHFQYIYQTLIDQYEYGLLKLRNQL